MRGLETRVLLAKTRILAMGNATAAAKQMVAVQKQAEADGRRDAENGIATLPSMFGDEPDLAQGWAAGQHEYRHLDGQAWRKQCEQATNTAAINCGLSHDVYVHRYSASVDHAMAQLPPIHRDAALQIALEWDYMTPQEREENLAWNAEYGCCAHGVELGYCPAGCGLGPDD